MFSKTYNYFIPLLVFYNKIIKLKPQLPTSYHDITVNVQITNFSFYSYSVHFYFSKIVFKIAYIISSFALYFKLTRK